VKNSRSKILSFGNYDGELRELQKLDGEVERGK